MKNTLSVLLIIVTILSTGCSKGDGDIVYNAVYQSGVYPERFDDCVNENLLAQRDYFLEAVVAVRQNLARCHAKSTEHCDLLADPEASNACTDTNEVKFGILISSIVDVVEIWNAL